MKKYLEYNSTELINQLKEKYKRFDFKFQLIQTNVNISVFFVLTDSDSLSKENRWENISKEIALRYQSKLETVYEKWNLYIIYITSDITPKDLKNKIENDKFSSRKIVEDCYDKEFNDNEANNLIIEHITNSDLKEIVKSTEEVKISDYSPKNQRLWDLLLDDKITIRERVEKDNFIREINSL